jgi:2,5-diamino-6-(ribosylamino)-4(3H)-pyrimidinone 5'-phosphate reductase
LDILIWRKITLTMTTRPHILINIAMTADGKIDSILRKGAAISSTADKNRVDQLRADSDAVLVGGRTLVNEDPRLTVKSARLRLERISRGLDENPVKVGIVSVADLELDGRFLNDGPARRFIYTTRRTPAEMITRLRQTGAEVFILGKQVVDLRRVMKSLYTHGLRTLMVEGGGTLIAALFRLELVDELTIYIAPRLLGGASAPTMVDGPGFRPSRAAGLQLVSVEKFDEGGGVLIHYFIEQKE